MGKTVHGGLQFTLDANRVRGQNPSCRAGASRFAYNWELEHIKLSLGEYKAGDQTARVPSAIDQHKEWAAWKKGHLGIDRGLDSSLDLPRLPAPAVANGAEDTQNVWGAISSGGSWSRETDRVRAGSGAARGSPDFGDVP
jgi:hypothetical protein